MHIKKGDTVKILTGKDRGKTGKVLSLLKSKRKAAIEGLNLKYKHVRPKRSGEKGQRIMYPSLIDLSNVMLVCPKCGKAVRISMKVLEKRTETSRDRRQRICKKCQAMMA
ncbi:MAG: 50S ribosomal protein L24 [Candidatus Kuenenbacteria bacterium]